MTDADGNSLYPSVYARTDTLLNITSNVPTTATSYSCNWTNYDLLIWNATFYNNIFASTVVPKGWFDTTSPTRVIIVFNPSTGIRFDLYKNGNDAVYASRDTTQITLPANHGFSLLGVKFNK